MVEKQWDKYELILMFASYNDYILGLSSKEALAYKLTEQYSNRLFNYGNDENELIKKYNNVLELLNVIELVNSGKKIPEKFFSFVEKYKDYKANKNKYDVFLLKATQQCLNGYCTNIKDFASDDFIGVLQKGIENVRKKHDEDDDTNMKMVSLYEPQDFSFTKPIKFTYFKREYYVRSWSDLYVSLVKCIQNDYPGEIEKFNGANLNTGWRIDIGDKQFVSQMANPKPINHGFYLMTKLSPEFIVKKITTIMKKIGIDFTDVSIYYKSNIVEKTTSRNI